MRYVLVYLPPPDSPLGHRGNRWLGRCAESGRPLVQPPCRGIDPDRLADLTRNPARIGLHATLLSPFRLKPPQTEEHLVAALTDFTTGLQSIALPPLILANQDGCFCLRPSHHVAPVQTLASRCLRAFDRFRAPLSPSEMARHKAAVLSGQEKKNLELWGDPYVFEQYRFFFPLTGRVAEGTLRERVLAALVELFAAVLHTHLTIDALRLLVEPAPGQPLRSVCCFPFSPPAPEPSERIAHDQHSHPQDLHPGYQCHPA